MSYTYLLHSPESISPIAAHAEHWFALEPARSPLELEALLLKVVTDGWIHQIDVSAESPDVVIARARTHSAKLTVLAAPLAGIVADYFKQVMETDAPFYFCLNGYDRPGQQLRRAALTRPPYLFTYHILKNRFPKRYQLDHSFAEFLDHLFIDQEFRYTLDEMLDDNKSLHHRLYEIARRQGIVSLQALLDSARAVRFAYGLIELGLTCDQAAAYCGGKHRQTIRGICARVLGTSSATAIRELTMNEVVLRADAHMFVVGHPRPDLPPIPGANRDK